MLRAEVESLIAQFHTKDRIILRLGKPKTFKACCFEKGIVPTQEKKKKT